MKNKAKHSCLEASVSDLIISVNTPKFLLKLDLHSASCGFTVHPRLLVLWCTIKAPFSKLHLNPASRRIPLLSLLMNRAESRPFPNMTSWMRRVHFLIGGG